MSRRCYLRSSKERRLRRLGMQDRRRQRWRGRRRTDRARRQRFSTRERRNVVTSQRLAIQQSRGDHVKQIHVLDQYRRRAGVSLLDHPRNFGIDELRGALRHLAPSLQLAAEEKLLLVVADEDRTDLVRKAPLRYVAASESRCLLDVAGSSGGYSVAPEHEFLGDTSTVCLDEICLELLSRDRDAVVFRQRPRHTERASARDNRDFVERIVALHLHRANGVATLVVG